MCKTLCTRLIIVFLFLISFIADAQVNYHSTDNKAIKQFEKGLLAYNNKVDDDALKYLLAAVDRDSGFYEAWDLLSRLYFELEEKESSLKALYKMVEIEPKKRPSDWYYIATLEQEKENFEVAFSSYTTYLDLGDDNFALLEQAVRSQDDCEFAIWSMKNPVAYDPVNLGPSINTEDPEYLPCLTADDQLLLFTRRVKDSRVPQGMQDNLYYTIRDEDRIWKVAVPLEGINSVYNEGAASISANGNTLVFTACAFYGEYGSGRNGFGSCDLFISSQKGNGWSSPQNIGNAINSAAWESQPSLSADGNTLYFIRAPKKKDKNPNQEIYVSQRINGGQWSKAQKLSGPVNTPYREETVLIHPDGQTLYFSSDGHPGMGGLDIFMSRLGKDGKWGEVKNLGYPINTPNDENSLLVATNGEIAYFSSTMEGGYGSFDLYSFELYPEARPKAVTYMKGRVFDYDDKSPLGAHFELIDLATSELVYSSSSDSINGEFLIPITYGKDYALNVEKESYLFYSENFQMKERQNDNPFIMNVPLRKITIGSEVVLRNVFFDSDEYSLKEESKIELNKLLTFLNQNPKVSIEVEGHTDNIGNNAHNRSLSDQRAKQVFQYLVDNGIDSNRLKYKGYGADSPISDNDTEEGRANNRRTSVSIIAK